MNAVLSCVSSVTGDSIVSERRLWEHLCLMRWLGLQGSLSSTKTSEGYQRVQDCIGCLTSCAAAL